MFRILITDDDEDLRELLTEAVGKWGYVTEVASNGDEALRKLRMEKFDIVITDLMMPGMDGLKLLDRIKGLDKDILVIIITGYATIETAVKAIESGAYDYIAKPFRLDELMIVIKNACERLKLVNQNKALLEELRSAYAEIESLRKALDGKSVGNGGGGSDGKPDIEAGTSALDVPRAVTSRGHHGYVEEADRILFQVKRDTDN